jgi:hypothetical protein
MGTGAGKRAAGCALIDVVRRVAVGSSVGVDCGTVGTGTVTVGNRVGIGTTVAKVVAGGCVGSGVGVVGDEQAVTTNNAKSISQRFMQSFCL